MEQEIKNLLKERFDRLPSVVQQAIQSANLHTQIEEISKRHQLHIDQMGNVEDEVILVMLGLEDAGDFANNLVTNAQITKDAATGIAQEVENQIFLPIRGYMQKFMEEQTDSARSIIAEITAPPAEKSVVMPSKLAAASASPTPTVPAAPTPTPPAPVSASVPPPTPLSAPATPPTPAPISLAPKPDLHAAEVMLTEKTVQTPVPGAATASTPVSKPQGYKTDPYREPIE